MNTLILEEGLTIMLTGMGVVFGFLVILIFSMIIMSNAIKLINKFVPEVVPEQKVSGAKRQGKDEEEIAIAIAAVMKSM